MRTNQLPKILSGAGVDAHSEFENTLRFKSLHVAHYEDVQKRENYMLYGLDDVGRVWSYDHKERKWQALNRFEGLNHA
jgi:hypothetical protein